MFFCATQKVQTGYRFFSVAQGPSTSISIESADRLLVFLGADHNFDAG